MEQALTPEQVAKRLQIGPRTVLELLRNGELPGRKVGGQWRVSPAALDEYLRGGNVDNEPLSAADAVAIKEGLEQIKSGRTISLAALSKELASNDDVPELEDEPSPSHQ